MSGVGVSGISLENYIWNMYIIISAVTGPKTATILYIVIVSFIETINYLVTFKFDSRLDSKYVTYTLVLNGLYLFIYYIVAINIWVTHFIVHRHE